MYEEARMMSTWPSWDSCVRGEGGFPHGKKRGRYVGVGSLGDVGGEFVVIDPHASGVADRDAVVVEDEADFEVLDDDVGCVDNVDAAACDVGGRADAEEGFVGGHLETGREGDVA